MRATTILAIVAIIAALGAVTSLIPVHQASAAPGGPQSANGNGQVSNAFSSSDREHGGGVLHAHTVTPNNQPCSVFCSGH